MQVRTISTHALPDARTLCLRAVAARIAFTWAPALGDTIALEIARNVVQMLAWLGDITPAEAVREALEHRRKHLGLRHVTETLIVHFAFTASVVWEQSAHGRKEAFESEPHPLLKLGGDLNTEARLRSWGNAKHGRSLSMRAEGATWLALAHDGELVTTAEGDSPDTAQAALADALEAA